jgi:hypothetical protein
MRSDFGPSATDPFLDVIRGLAFVRKATATEEEDLRLILVDRKGRRFPFAGELKTSYFDKASLHAAIAAAAARKKRRQDPTLLLARYVPLPSAEQLVEAGVNFVDLAGNMHVTLGPDYQRTVLGCVEAKRSREAQRITAAQLQVLFLFATQPEAAAWPVREIAEQAGVSKSKAAAVRGELMETGAVHGGTFRIPKATEELLVSGYANILRPKLVIGRFRAPERDLSDFEKRLPLALRGGATRYALSGGPAADAQQHYYRGPELSMFLSDHAPETLHRLRLLPDRHGPITLLKAFGQLVYWREFSSVTVAPPWLVYAELMQADDPRGHEAATEFYQEFIRNEPAASTTTRRR